MSGKPKSKQQCNLLYKEGYFYVMLDKYGLEVRGKCFDLCQSACVWLPVRLSVFIPMWSPCASLPVRPSVSVPMWSPCTSLPVYRCMEWVLSFHLDVGSRD